MYCGLQNAKRFRSNRTIHGPIMTRNIPLARAWQGLCSQGKLLQKYIPIAHPLANILKGKSYQVETNGDILRSLCILPGIFGNPENDDAYQWGGGSRQNRGLLPEPYSPMPRMWGYVCN